MASSYIYLFAITVLATSASGLKCYTGTAAAKTETDCTAPFDVCAKITTAGTATASCYTKAAPVAAGHPGDGCKDLASIPTCLCATDLCNDPSSTETTTASSNTEKSSASTQSAFQFISLIATSYLMKLLLA